MKQRRDVMVKGIAKQAVILQPGERSGFEQAIFIMAPDKDMEKVASAEELLELADSIASEYTVPCISAKKKTRFLPCLISFILGAGAAALGFALLPAFLA